MLRPRRVALIQRATRTRSRRDTSTLAFHRLDQGKRTRTRILKSLRKLEVKKSKAKAELLRQWIRISRESPERSAAITLPTPESLVLRICSLTLRSDNPSLTLCSASLRATCCSFHQRTRRKGLWSHPTVARSSMQTGRWARPWPTTTEA